MLRYMTRAPEVVTRVAYGCSNGIIPFVSKLGWSTLDSRSRQGGPAKIAMRAGCPFLVHCAFRRNRYASRCSAGLTFFGKASPPSKPTKAEGRTRNSTHCMGPSNEYGSTPCIKYALQRRLRERGSLCGSAFKLAWREQSYAQYFVAV